MIQGKWFPQGADLSDALSVRRGVFAREADDLDRESWNMVVYLDDTPVGTGRIWWRDGSFWIGDIGVLPAFRGRKLGDLALRLLLFKAQSHAAREVRLRTPEETADFFARLGFRQAAGPEAAPCQGMTEMFLPGEDIDLDTCKACKKKDCPSRRE